MEGLIPPVILFEKKGIIVMTNSAVIRMLDRSTLECKELRVKYGSYDPFDSEVFFQSERKNYGSYRADYNIV